MSAGEKELLRYAVLECLTSRHPAAVSEAGVERRVRLELDFRVAPEEVASALEVLRGEGLIGVTVDALGSTKWWVATSQGVLRVERKN